MENTYIQNRIIAIKTIISNIELAINTLLTGAQSYELDTGQSRTRVTRADLGNLKEMYKEYLNLLNELELSAGINKSVVQVYPAW